MCLKKRSFNIDRGDRPPILEEKGVRLPIPAPAQECSSKKRTHTIHNEPVVVDRVRQCFQREIGRLIAHAALSRRVIVRFMNGLSPSNETLRIAKDSVSLPTRHSLPRRSLNRGQQSEVHTFVRTAPRIQSRTVRCVTFGNNPQSFGSFPGSSTGSCGTMRPHAMNQHHLRFLFKFHRGGWRSVKRTNHLSGPDALASI